MSWKSKYEEISKKRIAEIDKLEKELDVFNKKYRELENKLRQALELIQKLEPNDKNKY
jgi:uncharacterized protein YjaG (DUF416 family)